MRPTSPQSIVRGLLAGSGAVALASSVAVITRGAIAIPGGGATTASTDSVLRFYAAWWGSSGALMLRAAGQPAPQAQLVRTVAATTLVGGVARLLAARRSGWPHPLFRALTAAELVLPPLLLAAHRAASNRSQKG